MMYVVLLLSLLLINTARLSRSTWPPARDRPPSFSYPGITDRFERGPHGSTCLRHGGRYLFGADPVSLHVDDLATPPAPELVADAVMDKVSVIPVCSRSTSTVGFMGRLAKLANRRRRIRALRLRLAAGSDRYRTTVEGDGARTCGRAASSTWRS